jgi:hypothetical protein
MKGCVGGMVDEKVTEEDAVRWPFYKSACRPLPNVLRPRFTASFHCFGFLLYSTLSRLSSNLQPPAIYAATSWQSARSFSGLFVAGSSGSRGCRGYVAAREADFRGGSLGGKMSAEET